MKRARHTTTMLLSNLILASYTLVSPIHPLPDEDMVFYTYLLDSSGSIVHTLSHDHYVASTPYLLEDGTVLRPARTTETDIAGGAGGRIERLTLEGEVLWSYDMDSNFAVQHHDIEPMPNGNILCVAWEYKTQEEALGKGIISHTGPLWVDMIIEIEPVGADSANIVWEWRAWDHLVQSYNSGFDGYVPDIADYPHRLDANFGYSGGDGPSPPMGNPDFLHINSISYNHELDQIVFSARKTNEIYIIDHSTTTEEASSGSGGACGRGGDYLYRWGNPGIHTGESSASQALFAPHSANWIGQGYPGDGNIIVFNNGVNRPGNDYSSVEEIDPPTDTFGQYIFESPGSYHSPVWHYNGDQSYFTSYQGGAYRLENGNTFITITDSKDIIEVSADGDIEWSYEWEGDGYIARAQRYSDDYVTIYSQGDINSDGAIDILDVVLMVNLIIDGEFLGPADMNSDGIIDILDIVIMINLITG